MEPESLIPLNPRDFLILFSLAAAGEQHGYGIVKAVERQSDGAVRLDPANLYRSIKRLTRDGLVVEAGRRAAPDTDNERRRFYAITDFGRQVVALEASRLARLADAARAGRLIPLEGEAS
jgi:DNA-binding PadR family transcriptional regulator